MNRKLIAALALVLGAFAIWWFAGRTSEPTANLGSQQARRGEIKQTTATPARAGNAAAERDLAAMWSLDTDPQGHIVLEGQVVDASGRGIGGALVWITSAPARTTTTEDDGSFSFDKLVGRTYYLGARKDLLIGGPISFKVTEKPEPAIIRLAEGAAIEVTVRDEANQPIAGASVTGGENEQVEKTGADGKAKLAPVRPGWVSVHASAAGYAPSGTFVTIGSGGVTGHAELTLRKGFAVSGTVVDEAGKPIAKVRVSEARAMWSLGHASDSVLTDDKGAFTLPALANGEHTLAATDGEHAPARSEPFSVSDRPVSGLTITMKAGAVIAGVVVDAKGTPVPAASVKVAGKGQDAWFNQGARQTTTTREGTFELRGLARIKLEARAESDTVASKVVEIDLVETPAVKDVRLVLDVAGRISGIVVDEHGAPVPEVGVNAFPDFLSGGTNTQGLAITGMASATTDGAGAFTVHGLAEGTYKLWAGRSANLWQEWGQHGIAAKTGDTNVKLVMPTPGELKGSVVLEGSTSPPVPASVQVGSQTPTPVAQDGTFVLKDVVPGSHDVMFRGPKFAELTKRDVKIEPGKTTDLGKVTVFRGRRLTGKVVDKRGAPVAGAKVKVGQMLFSSEGTDADATANFEEMSGVRSAISDRDGAFTIVGVPKNTATAIADHPDRGRSTGLEIAEGTDDPPPITLTLRGYGSIKGKVTSKGKPLGNVTVGQSTKGGGAAASFVQTADDGTFAMAKVPEGTIVVQAMQQQMMSMKSAAATVTVVAGKQSTVTIDIPVGELVAAVTVKPLAGNQVDAAQVFLFSGQAAFINAKQLTDGFLQGGAQGMKFWLGKDAPQPEFDELVPGDYSVCTIPITGSLSDAQFQQRLQANLAVLKVYCKGFKLLPSPAKQSVTHEVPAMTPLPE